MRKWTKNGLISLRSIVCIAVSTCLLIFYGCAGCGYFSQLACNNEAQYWEYKSQIESIFRTAGKIYPNLESDYEIIREYVNLPDVPPGIDQGIQKATRILGVADAAWTSLSQLVFEETCHHPDHVDEAIKHFQQIKNAHKNMKEIHQQVMGAMK